MSEDCILEGLHRADAWLQVEDRIEIAEGMLREKMAEIRKVRATG